MTDTGVSLNFGGLSEPCSYSQAKFVVLPVPYDLTTSYLPGTRRGPLAILEASAYMELYDLELETNPIEQGIFTFPLLPVEATGPEAMIKSVKDQASKILQENKIVITLGGEHSITLGVVEAYLEKYNSLTVIQFDAHTDMRDSYEGSPYSHACVMRRVHDMGLPFVQIGVRSLSQEEAGFRKMHGIQTLDAASLYKDGIPPEILPWDFPEHIYITFDVDCFDASLMPSTGTPEPGGLTWYQVIDLLHGVAAGRKICGFDVVELAPNPCMPAPDYTTAKLVYNIIGLAVIS